MFSILLAAGLIPTTLASEAVEEKGAVLPRIQNAHATVDAFVRLTATDGEAIVTADSGIFCS